MNLQKYTQKSIEALQDAQRLAEEYSNQQLQQEHLLLALLRDAKGLIPQLVDKVNGNAESLQQALENTIEEFAKVEGDMGKVYLSVELDRALAAAESIADKMGDEYVSVEHLVLGMFSKPSATMKKIFAEQRLDESAFTAAVKALRGNQKVTSDSPEDTYDALSKYGQDLVELARAQKLDPVIGRDEEIRNVILILSRKSKNNP